MEAQTQYISAEELERAVLKYEKRKGRFISFFFDTNNWWYTLKLWRIFFTYSGTKDKAWLKVAGGHGWEVKKLQGFFFIIRIAWHEFHFYYQKPYKRRGVPKMDNPPEPPPKPVKRYWWESVHQMD